MQLFICICFFFYLFTLKHKTYCVIAYLGFIFDFDRSQFYFTCFTYIMEYMNIFMYILYYDFVLLHRDKKQTIHATFGKQQRTENDLQI